ncbi:MAG: glycosyltransferase [Gammaproteobacteria bacterium]
MDTNTPSGNDLSLDEVIQEHAAENLVAAKIGYQLFIDRDFPDPLPYANLAGIYILENRLEEALVLARKAISIDPEFVDAYTKLGYILEHIEETSNSSKHNEEILNCYKKSVELEPENALAHFSLANLYTNSGNIEQAEKHHLEAIKIKPNYAHAHLNIAILYVSKRRYDLAASSFKKAFSSENLLKSALCAHWHMRMRMCDWSEYSEMICSIKNAVEEIKCLNEIPEVLNTVIPFTFINLYEDPGFLLTTSEQYIDSVKKIVTEQNQSIIFNRTQSKNNLVKLAFISADYHNHATAFLMAELFELIDKDKFEIYAISFDLEGHDSQMRKRIETACDQFHDVCKKTDKEIAQLIADLNTDIAIDLKGYTQNSRPAILAYKPAPIQINYLGFPGSMGADFIDYIIADPYVIPEQEQDFYSEKIAYLPDSYQVNDRLRPVQKNIPSRTECGLPEEGFIFCSFNNNYKITPEVFDIWMDLLKETPGSILWLLEDNQWAKSNLHTEAKSRGIDPSRLIFSGLIRLDYHLARAKNADLFLDTFPCNAHTTASDALWSGLPLITCSGRSFSSRVAGSLLTAVGLPELITSNLHDYKTLALELANNPEKLSEIKSKLVNKREICALFDTEHYKDNLQVAFEEMIRLQQHHSTNETFYVSKLENKPIRNQNIPNRKVTPFNFDEEPPTQEISLNDVIEKHAANDLAYAKKGYQAFIDAKFDNVIPYSNLASIYFQEGDLEKAISLLKQGLEINPVYIDAYMKLGSLLEIQKRDNYIDQVIECFLKVIEIKPDHAQAHFSLGNILSDQKPVEPAIFHLQKAIELNPEYALASFNLGNIFQGEEDLINAEKYFMQAYQADPSMKNALGKWLHTRMHMCNWSDYDEVCSSLQIDDVNVVPTASNISEVFSPFSLINILDDPQMQLEISKKYLSTKIENIDSSIILFKQNESLDHSENDQIKVAFLSSDFHEHATSYLMAETFELFSRKQFETHIFSFGEDDNSEIRNRIKLSCNYFYDVKEKTDLEIANLIAEKNIDIAIDLKGYTQGCRPAILSYRPAPIQVNYLGYPGSMGADFIDYIIADPFIIPESSQSNYSEKIMYLPDSYQVNDRRRPVHEKIPSRHDCGLPADGFVFACFNNTYKITPDVFKVWITLLNETPGSVLWLLDSNSWAKDNLKAHVESYDINPARLIFAEKLPLDHHLARIQNADLFLDTFPCNAHTTASDALWVGLPLLTCVGKGFASRVAGSILNAVELEELITIDLASYKSVAFSLAHHPEKLAQIRSKLINNKYNCALFDTKRFQNNLQMGLKHMVNMNKNGSVAETFHVSDLKDELIDNMLAELVDDTPPDEAEVTDQKIALLINIALIFPENYPHSDIFNEVAETLLYAFDKIGFDTTITANTFINDGINIVIGANLLKESDMQLIPEASVIYNFEQITDNSEWMTSGLYDLFQRFRVWDYSKKNITALKEKGFTRVTHMPVGYAPSLTRIPKADVQDIDVLFYGSTNERRLEILNQLKAAGLKVEILYGVYGAERDEYIARSKIIVNIHYYDCNVFEQVRVSYLLANKKAVVCECSETTDVDTELKDAIALVPYENIVEKCIELIKSDQTRVALEENGFARFTSRDSIEYLSNALNELNQESGEKKPHNKEVSFATKTPSGVIEEYPEINEEHSKEIITPLISILIPTYNHSKYIESAISSALNQDYPNFEVVVVDDGSTDNTIDIIKDIEDERFRFIIKEHSGAPATRNRCIIEAYGDYFLWLDSDDELMPDILVNYANTLKEFPETDIVYGDLDMFDESDGWNQIHSYPDHQKDQHLLPRLLKGCGIPNGGSLVKRSIYNRYGGYDESFRRAHDYDFWCRVAKLSNIKHSGMISYRYRMHGSNISFGNTEPDHSFEAAIVKKTCNRFGVRDLSPELDWSNEDNAYTKAWLKIGSILQTHQDYENALIAFQQALSTTDDNEVLQQEVQSAVQNLITLINTNKNPHKGEYILPLEINNKSLGTDPLVSVIVYNITDDARMTNALQSLIEQTYSKWQAIVVNDNNAEQHSTIDPFERILFIDTQNKSNIAETLNSALPFTEGSILCYLDEGRFKPEHFKTLVDELKNGEVDFAYSKTSISDNNADSINSEYNYLSEITFSKDLLDIANFIPINTWGHRRDLLEKSGLFDNDLNVLEDWEMLLRFSRLTNFKQLSKSTVVIDHDLTSEKNISGVNKLFKQLYQRYPSDNDNVVNERAKLLETMSSSITQELVQPVQSKIPDIINIGSGKDFKQNCINIDISKASNPDIVGDLSDRNLIGSVFKSQRFGDITFDKNKFDQIIANDVLEHIPDLVTAMTNCLKLLKVGGQFHIEVPYDLSYGAWQDPTHVRAFNERSWLYYTDWYWYLGWKESRFDITKLDFMLSPVGIKMQQEGNSMEQILTQPRAVDSMSTILTKRLLTEEEMKAGLARMDGV